MDEKCIALCDFDGVDGELSFRAGEVITVAAKGTDSGFWEGTTERHPTRGTFPNCMVSSNMQPGRPPAFVNRAVALFNYTPKGPAELPMRKHDVVIVVGPGESPGWWFGINETARDRLVLDEDPETDLASSTAVATVASCNPAIAAAAEPKLFPSNFVSSNLVKAQFEFHGRQRCELTIEPGDVILIHRRWNDGWWEGSLPAEPRPCSKARAKSSASGALNTAKAAGGGVIVGGLRRGIFPSNYTMPNVMNVGPPSLCCPCCRTVFAPGSAECKECGRNADIIRSMQRALTDFTDGAGGDKCDLFAYVDLDPSKGKGSLLAAHELKDTTVRPRLATGAAATAAAKAAAAKGAA